MSDTRFWLLAKAKAQFVANLDIAESEFYSFSIMRHQATLNVTPACMTRLARMFGIEQITFSQFSRDMLTFVHEGIAFTSICSEVDRAKIAGEFLTRCIDAHLQEAGY